MAVAVNDNWGDYMSVADTGVLLENATRVTLATSIMTVGGSLDFGDILPFLKGTPLEHARLPKASFKIQKYKLPKDKKEACNTLYKIKDNVLAHHEACNGWGPDEILKLGKIVLWVQDKNHKNKLGQNVVEQELKKVHKFVRHIGDALDDMVVLFISPNGVMSNIPKVLYNPCDTIGKITLNDKVI